LFVGFLKFVVCIFILNFNNYKIYFYIVHIRNLTGYTAPASFLQQLTWLAFHHSPLVRKIDAIRAYHFGTHFLVEIDVLLPHDLHLREAVHVGIGLEQKVESLPEVERAFVHLNCERIATNSNNISVDQNQQIITSINRRRHKIV
jgi:divalent metal cation (Fe/Co/Zn/Cd) transporter